MVFHALVHERKVPRADISFISINYGVKLDLKDYDVAADQFYMVDFSMQPDEKMLDLAIGLKNFTWIDHHETALAVEKTHPKLQALPGIRSSRCAACELCWEHFFGQEPLPLLVRLVSEYDTWKNSDKRRWDDEILPVNYALSGFDSRPFKAIDWWDFQLKMMRKDPIKANRDFDTHWLDTGRIIKGYAERDADRMMAGSAFQGTFAGKSAIMVNGTGNSTMFERAFDPYAVDLLVMYKHIRGQYWTVSLYTYKDDVHCGELAAKLGSAGPMPSGGGHQKAAGFQTDWNYLSTLMCTKDGKEVK